MSGKNILVAAALLVISAGGLFWAAQLLGEAEDDGQPPAALRPAPVPEPTPEVAMLLPDGGAAVQEPAPIEMPPSVEAAGTEPGITVHIGPKSTLFSGQPKGPPRTVQLDLGVYRSRKDLGEPLHSFEMDSQGSHDLELPWNVVAPGSDDKQPSLWLRSTGPGLLTRIDYKRAPAEPGGTVNMNVLALPGAVIEGRLLGPDGEPVAGRVDWWSLGEDGGFSRGLAGKAGADGLFRGELRKEGNLGLRARGTREEHAEGIAVFIDDRYELGTGFFELMDVSFTEPLSFIEIRVSGPGLIRGQVLDDKGVPAAGVPLTIILAELDEGTLDKQQVFYRLREVEREGRGHHSMFTVTDTMGAFAFRGLRNDLFNVRASDSDGVFGQFTILLTEQPVGTDGQPLELRLTRRHLAIHVRHEDGSLPEEELETHRVTPWDSPLEQWPEEPGLLVALTPEHAHINGWRGPYLSAKHTGPGEFIVELDDELDVELSVELGVLGGSFPWRPLAVDVPLDVGRLDVDLVLPPIGPLGALLLDVVDAAGTPLVEQVRVRVIDPARGVVLVDKPCHYTDDEDWPMRFDLPEGEYRLLVEGHPWMDSHHGTIMRRREHGAFEQHLKISQGAEVRVTAKLGAASRLELAVLGSVSEADREAVRKRHGGAADDDVIDYYAPSVSLRLDREGRWPETPEFARYAMENTSAAGTHLFSSLAMGTEETSEPLTPGTYTLVATTPGGRELKHVVTFVPGETLSVTLRFD